MKKQIFILIFTLNVVTYIEGNDNFPLNLENIPCLNSTIKEVVDQFPNYREQDIAMTKYVKKAPIASLPCITSESSLLSISIELGLNGLKMLTGNNVNHLEKATYKNNKLQSFVRLHPNKKKAAEFNSKTGVFIFYESDGITKKREYGFYAYDNLKIQYFIQYNKNKIVETYCYNKNKIIVDCKISNILPKTICSAGVYDDDNDGNAERTIECYTPNLYKYIYLHTDKKEYFFKPNGVLEKAYHNYKEYIVYDNGSIKQEISYNKYSNTRFPWEVESYATFSPTGIKEIEFEHQVYDYEYIHKAYYSNGILEAKADIKQDKIDIICYENTERHKIIPCTKKYPITVYNNEKIIYYENTTKVKEVIFTKENGEYIQNVIYYDINGDEVDNEEDNEEETKQNNDVEKLENNDTQKIQ